MLATGDGASTSGAILRRQECYVAVNGSDADAARHWSLSSVTMASTAERQN